MSTERTRVTTYSEDYRCDECGKGYMRHDGIVLDSNPPIYPHKCNNNSCGAVKNFAYRYPRLVHETSEPY